MTEKMRIGELSQKAGVTPRTVRYYEKLGLLQPSDRDGKGFRYYTEVELARLHKINALKQNSLTLEEIQQVIDLYFADPTGIRGKQKVLEILLGHLQETEEKIENLTQFRSELHTKIARMEELIEQAKAKSS